MIGHYKIKRAPHLIMLYYEKIINENTDEWVLFIHGLGGSLKTWKYQIDQFTPYYNVLLVDLDGHGKSSRLKLFSRYKPTSTAKEIHEILLTECISHVKIVSLSLGTLVALEFSYLYPDMVESMVLAGGIINLDHARRFVFGVANFVTKHFPKTFAYNMFAHIIMPAKKHKLSRDIFIREAKKVDDNVFKRWVECIGKADRKLKDYIHTLTKRGIPTLFISGREDFMFLSGIKDVCKRVHNFNMQILRNCGHVCSIEKSELFNKLTLNFFRSEELSSQ